METRHVKIKYENALSGKKHLLNSEISLLQILNKINSYKSLRKSELNTKNKLRIELGNVKKELKSLHDSFPKQHHKTENKERPEKIISVEHNRDVSSELEEIREKLEKLEK